MIRKIHVDRIEAADAIVAFFVIVTDFSTEIIVAMFMKTYNYVICRDYEHPIFFGNSEMRVRLPTENCHITKSQSLVRSINVVHVVPK